MPFLVVDMQEMHEDMVKNHRSPDSGLQQVPHYQDQNCGFVCKSRSPLSQRSKENVDCVQNVSAETGKAFNLSHGVTQRNWPDCEVLECVKNLFEKSEDAQLSDGDWIQAQKQKAGYWCWTGVIESEPWGSVVPRSRAWWVCARNLNGAKDEVDHFFMRYLNAFKLAGPITPAEEVVLLDDVVRLDACEELHMPTLFGTGLRLSKRGEVSEVQWKSVHKEHYEMFGQQWPPRASATRRSPKTGCSCASGRRRCWWQRLSRPILI